MKEIEIQDIYPQFRKDIDGNEIFFGYSVHVYLINQLNSKYSMDLRGVVAIKSRKDWFIRLPAKKDFDYETKSPVLYPVIDFIDKEYKENFIKQIKENFIDFLDKNPNYSYHKSNTKLYKKTKKTP